MLIETALRNLFYLPRFIQTGDNDPPGEGHFVGRGKRPFPKQNTQDQGDDNRFHFNPQKKNDDRLLSSIYYKEAKDAYNHFENQLVKSQPEGWIGENRFCLIYLSAKHNEHLPFMFGRVRDSYPISGGYIDNFQFLELYFVQKDQPASRVILHADDILLDRYSEQPAQSYCIRIKFLASPQDMNDFGDAENQFIQKGFSIQFDSGYADLLKLPGLDPESLPWFYIVGSHWFDKLPKSIKPVIETNLHQLLRQNRIMLNYHPKKLPRRIKPLNQVLGLKPGLDDFIFYEPIDAIEAARMVDRSFRKRYQLPAGNEA